MLLSNKISRRRLLGKTLSAAAAVTLPGCPSPRQETPPAKPASRRGEAEPGPNEQIGVGIIGCGRRNGQLMVGRGGQGKPPAYARVVAVADLNITRAEQWAAKYKCPAFHDYRELLDRKEVEVVIYATPEHWHYLPCIHAVQAGKDVYGEQPLSHTIHEGRVMADAVRTHGRVFQTGEQQRSHPRTRKAAELILNGRIGKIQSVIGYNYPSPWESRLPGETVPDGLDWDRWCAPNEVVPYNTNLYLSRVPYEREWLQPAEENAIGPGWMSFRPYSGGELVNWGCHGLSMVQWVLGMDDSGPVEVWTEPAEKLEPLRYSTTSQNRGIAVMLMPARATSCPRRSERRNWGKARRGPRGGIPMFRRSLSVFVLVAGGAALVGCPAARDSSVLEKTDASSAAAPDIAEVVLKPPPEPSIRYFPLDAPAGMGQAVVVEGFPLVHTRQIMPLDSEGNLVGNASADQQIEQVLANLQTVLDAAGSGLDKLVRLNIYADSPRTSNQVRVKLSERLDSAVRPAITSVVTPLPEPKALVAVDAVAVAAGKADSVVLLAKEDASAEPPCADAAVMPRGGVVYFSGQVDKSPLAEATVKSLTKLLDAVAQLNLERSRVVQLKVFVDSAQAAEEVLREIKQLFPDQLVPPVVFVEWIASAPIEIEMIVHLPLQGSRPNQPLRFETPSGEKPSPVFSRVAVIEAYHQIYISGLTARAAGSGEAQVRDVFAQLQQILTETGSDLRHLAKATYYVSDDDASNMLNKLRPEFYDPQRPPAASKAMVHGVAEPDRTLTVDLIAVRRGTD